MGIFPRRWITLRAAFWVAMVPGVLTPTNWRATRGGCNNSKGDGLTKGNGACNNPIIGRQTSSKTD